MTAMDPKILAAVFASIAALTMSGTGSMEDIQNLEGQKFLQDFELPFNADSILGSIREKPEPENQATITVEFKSVKTVLETSGRILSVEKFTFLNSERQGFESSEPVEFKDYSGKLTFSNETEINGKASGFIHQDLNYTKSMNLGLATDATDIKVEDINRSKVELNNVDITFESDTGTKISSENAPLIVNSFTGNISIYPNEKQMIIEGLVDRVEAGTTSFGG